MLKANNKRFTCSILMHAGRWDNCQQMIAWCKDNDIPYLPRQIDHSWHDIKFWYNKEQTQWWDDLRGIERKVPLHKKIISIVNLDSQGRSCCGGTELSVDGNTSCGQTYIPGNNFQGWSCSVNYFFAYVKQVTKEVFLNKDCQMNFNKKIANTKYVDMWKHILNNKEHKDILNTRLSEQKSKYEEKLKTQEKKYKFKLENYNFCYQILNRYCMKNTSFLDLYSLDFYLYNNSF
jgi:hypothetical protein